MRVNNSMTNKIRALILSSRKAREKAEMKWRTEEGSFRHSRKAETRIESRQKVYGGWFI